MASYKEIRLPLAEGPHKAVAVIWAYTGFAVICAIEREHLPPLRSDQTFAFPGQAFEAARALWLSSLSAQAAYGTKGLGRFGKARF